MFLRRRSVERLLLEAQPALEASDRPVHVAEAAINPIGSPALVDFLPWWALPILLLTSPERPGIVVVTDRDLILCWRTILLQRFRSSRAALDAVIVRRPSDRTRFGRPRVDLETPTGRVRLQFARRDAAVAGEIRERLLAPGPA